MNKQRWTGKGAIWSLQSGLTLSIAAIGIGFPSAPHAYEAEEQPSEEQQTYRSTRPSRSTGGESTVNKQALESKLDTVVQTQQEILQRLDEIMEELKVVKIRATLR